MIYYLLTFVLGAIVGSFLNVCIYRIPRGLSIVSPASSCPACKRPIKPWHNVPIISYLLLRGKCAYCASKISLRYLIVEFTNAVLYVLVLYQYALSWHLLACFAFVSALVVITFIDLDFQIIPDVITLPFAVIGLLLSSWILIDPFNHASLLGIFNSLIGSVLGFGLFYLIAVLSKGGMGGGDIKLMAAIGAFTGYKGVLLTTFLGSLAGAVVGIYLMIFKGAKGKSKIPFGPFLAFGAICTILWGREILRWYLSGGFR